MIGVSPNCARAHGIPSTPTWISPARTTTSASTDGGVHVANSRCRSERTRIFMLGPQKRQNDQPADDTAFPRKRRNDQAADDRAFPRKRLPSHPFLGG